MGDATRKSKSSKKTKNSIGCLLLRRSRRRANSEPPKGRRSDREKTCSPSTLKPRKIARDDGYSETRNSESDSGFLSFESFESKRGSESYSSMHRMSRSSGVRKEDGGEHLQGDYLAESERSASLGDDRAFAYQPDIVDLNDNSFARCYQEEREYNSDGVSLGSANVCLRCFCLPRLFKSRNPSNRGKKASSSDSFSQKLEDSLFDLRGSTLLRTISDLRSSIAEGPSTERDQCFLKLVYAEHCCVDPALCNKEKFAALNSHLRTLVDCMPRSFCDCESKTNWTSYVLNETGYVSQRRNAVCETYDRTRETACKAFCSFMTLKALLRYDLL